MMTYSSVQIKISEEERGVNAPSNSDFSRRRSRDFYSSQSRTQEQRVEGGKGSYETGEKEEVDEKQQHADPKPKKGEHTKNNGNPFQSHEDESLGEPSRKHKKSLDSKNSPKINI